MSIKTKKKRGKQSPSSTTRTKVSKVALMIKRKGKMELSSRDQAASLGSFWVAPHDYWINKVLLLSFLCNFWKVKTDK
jgi:hypothetical protein